MPIGFQRWRSLLFMHWPVAEAALRPLVPPELSIDLYDGLAYLGVTPFLVYGARPANLPAPLGLQFPEVNVRTYVHVEGADPGVYFFSLDARSLTTLAAARAFVGLRYFPAQMRFSQRDGIMEYQARRLAGRRPRLRVQFEPGEPLGTAPLGSLDHFLIERYLAHAKRSNGLLTVPLHHRPYALQRARILVHKNELIAADGLPALAEPAPFTHCAAGLDVEIFSPRRR
ncbi:MAG TPA: DUF2071 domain-containing protein [Chloroflexota bacterium]|nr:DUF2071 domain-containing protein [Chloroflexota bacterium]